MTLALVAAGCGAKANDRAFPTATSERAGSSSQPGKDAGTATTQGDPGGPSTTSGSTIPSIPGGADAIHNGLVQGFKTAGLTDKQAGCLADGYEKLGLSSPDGAAKLDYQKVLNLFDQCNVSLSDLGRQFPGGGSSGGN